jgi:hypothetical protein
MKKVEKPSNSEYYTPSSEPFRIYIFIALLEDGTLDVQEEGQKKSFVCILSCKNHKISLLLSIWNIEKLD